MVVDVVANPFPSESVTLLACIVITYTVPFASAVVGVMLSVFPLMVVLNLTVFPLKVLSSITAVFPNLIASLKVILITLFVATFTELLAGFILVIFGAALAIWEVAEVVVAAVLNLVISCVAKPLPARSVTQLGFNVSV